MPMMAYKVSEELGVYSNIHPGEYASKYEVPLLMKTLSKVRDILSDFDKYCFCVLLNNGVTIENWQLEGLPSRRPVFIIFDETGRTPVELLDGTSVVFHAHVNMESQREEFPLLFNFPLGCNSFVPEMSCLQPAQRTISIFFSGNLHAGRSRLFRQLARIPLPVPLRFLSFFRRHIKAVFDDEIPGAYIRFTDGFSKGLTVGEYGRMISNSKIVISPPGISNPECFRHYEGLRAGCVVLVEKIPHKEQLSGSPLIEVGDWKNGFRIARDLLADPLALERISSRSRAWYKDHLEPESLARYIVTSVRSVVN